MFTTHLFPTTSKNKIRIIACRIISSFLLVTLAAYSVTAQEKDEKFEGWENLKSNVPEWFRDAKFGIYFHWGVYNVPAFNSEWYSRTMYVPNTSPYKHHQETYGSLKTFGYKDFIPQFRAEKFNADEWVDLFAKAGAKFTGPVSEHADGFSMWDSKTNPWNARKMGPKKDIVGQMEKAVRKHHLKFITTFHHQWQWGWYPTFDTSVDAGNPAYASLYGPVTSVAAWQQKDSAEKPDEAFCKQWLSKVKEVVTKYKPDLLYFDSRLNHIMQPYRKEMVTLFQQTAGGKDNKVLLYKGKELPAQVGVNMHEKTRLNKLAEKIWLTEEPISTYSWSYTTDMKLRTAKDILHGLVDIVSKNGIFMLNISPKADGTIPQEQKDILLSLGDWLRQNGEAIYGTRPWYTFGEGPQTEGGKNDEKQKDRTKYFEINYTAEDVRYTTKGKAVYAILLGSTEKAGKMLFKAFKKDSLPSASSISKVTSLPTNHPLHWEHVSDGLSVDVPRQDAGMMATVIKIETR